jgi:hypothetical protein
MFSRPKESLEDEEEEEDEDEEDSAVVFEGVSIRFI